MAEIFKFKDHLYDLRKNNCIERRIIKSCKYGSETVSNLGSKLWDILPENINPNLGELFRGSFRGGGGGKIAPSLKLVPVMLET